jgi:hypothetical protein
MIKLLWKVFPALVIIILGAVLWFGYKSVKSFFTRKEQITINQTTVLQEIESLGKLELVKYHFKDVVEFEKEDYSWLPSSKVVLIAAGEAVGCIDLTKIKQQDILQLKDTVIITLPPGNFAILKLITINRRCTTCNTLIFKTEILLTRLIGQQKNN